MKITKILILSLVFLTSGCASTNTSNNQITEVKPKLEHTQKEKWSFMVGKWFSSQPTKNGGIKQQIMTRAEKGTYEITFRIIDKDGNIKKQTEAGHWGVSGPIYFTSFRGWVKDNKFTPSNPSSPYNYDAYKIIKLNNKAFEYESFETGDVYSLKKVSNDFVFPEK